MAYEVQSFPGFGAGLNLRDKADAVQPEEAIDCLNVEFTRRGTVKQRTGYSVFTQTELDGQGDTLYPHYESDGTKHLIVGDTATGQLTSLNVAGSEVDIEAVFSTGGCFGFARFGAPGNEYTYIGNGIDELWYYDGSTFTNVPDDTGAREPPKGGALAVTPVSNRLVNGRFTTTTGGPNLTTSTPSHVFFSDAGNPVVWGDNNYLQIAPGDGESVQDIVRWREFVFIFKETKFFVYTGETTDASGNPVFNGYMVDTGQGACGPRAVTADETGVYFASRNGVFRTTGGEPEDISELVRPIWRGGSSEYFTGGELNHAGISAVAVNAFDGRIYVNYPHTGTTNTRTLVYDTTNNWWAPWDVAAADMAPFRSTSQDRMFFTYPTGNNSVAVLDTTTNDAGSAITAHWRSGWVDWGLTMDKTVREAKLWGTGRLQFAISNEFAGSPFYAHGNALETVQFSDATVPTWESGFWETGTWGAVSARINPKLVRHAARGTSHSFYFFNNTLDKSFTVHRLDAHLRESLVPSKL